MATLPQLKEGILLNPGQVPGEADVLFLAGVAEQTSSISLPSQSSTTAQMTASLTAAGLDTTGIEKVAQS